MLDALWFKSHIQPTHLELEYLILAPLTCLALRSAGGRDTHAWGSSADRAAHLACQQIRGVSRHGSAGSTSVAAGDARRTQRRTSVYVISIRINTLTGE